MTNMSGVIHSTDRKQAYSRAKTCTPETAQARGVPEDKSYLRAYLAHMAGSSRSEAAKRMFTLYLKMEHRRLLDA